MPGLESAVCPGTLFSVSETVWVRGVLLPPSSSPFVVLLVDISGEHVCGIFLKIIEKQKVLKVNYEFMLIVLVHVQDSRVFTFLIYVYLFFSPHSHSRFSKSLGMIVIMLYSILIALSHSTQNSNTNVTTNNIMT